MQPYLVHTVIDKYGKYKYLGWKEIKSLSGKNIVKIGVGEFNSVYLGSDGVVYAYGGNMDGECGLPDVEKELIFQQRLNILENMAKRL